jgi:membrane dipeptidase
MSDIEEDSDSMYDFGLKKEDEQRSLDIHEKSVIVNGLSTFYGVNEITNINPVRVSRYYELMSRGGVTGVNFTIAIDHSFSEACRNISLVVNSLEHAASGKLVQVRSGEEIREVKRSDGCGLLFGFQNTLPVEFNLGFLKTFHTLGVRIVQLTYQKRNLVGDGCGEKEDAGLSEFGVKVVEELNRLGILIDLSHCGYKTTMEAIELSKSPVAFTHANAKALNDCIRCKSDEQIHALTEKEGVMGITVLSKFLRPNGGMTGTTLEDFLDHVAYVVDLVGVDHVGLGFDVFELRSKEDFQEHHEGRFYLKYPEMKMGAKEEPYENYFCEGLRSMSETLNVTRGLVSRGYSDEEIEKILGENFLRLFKRISM